MRTLKTKTQTSSKDQLIRKCHRCGYVIQSEREVERCPECRKAFLPLNYFSKVKYQAVKDYSDLYAYTEELKEEDLIRGIFVLW